jgi:DNA repair exonuclease SbcCD ATPase subunit
MLKATLLSLFLALAVPLGVRAQTQAETQTDAEAKRVEAAIARIQQAQASVYQQFQMAQELRRAELAKSDPFAPQPNTMAPPPGDYNELQRQREAREQRIKDLSAELDRLYARYQELESQKASLLNRLGELTRTP